MSDFAYDPEAAEDPTSWLGYRYHTHARSTGGGLVVLVDGIAQGLTNEADTQPGPFGDPPEGRWFLICERHSAILSGITQTELRPHMSAPGGWCDGCHQDARKLEPRCPHGCRGRLRWVEDQWYCRACGDEWHPEVFPENVLSDLPDPLTQEPGDR